MILQILHIGFRTNGVIAIYSLFHLVLVQWIVYRVLLHDNTTPIEISLIKWSLQELVIKPIMGPVEVLICQTPGIAKGAKTFIKFVLVC